MMPEARSQEQLEAFERLWQGPPGLKAWFCVVNNQRLGKRFMITAFSFFVAGGLLALLMRVQLAVSENDFMGPQVYNQVFTMHGSTMMYLFAVPFLEGLALYLLPLMIGSRDVAFPRLTAFSYWTYLFGGLLFYASFLAGTVPDAGWFAYTPLSGPEYAGKGVDFWLLGLALVEIAGLTAAVEIVVTILKLRAPGMSINRMPLFAWALLVSGVMMIFAFTVLLVATLLLELDRTAGTRFFDPDNGGSSLLWQHLFWFFGHPEVYIIFLPATGILSMVVATVARRALVGYTLVATAIVATGFVSFGLWMHHMYTTGLPELAMGFFAAASLLIGVASGIQIFAWIATLWNSRPAMSTHLLYFLGFVFIFVLGGFTGVMVAVVPFDWQVHDTFFIVAHFHYVLIGGVVFPVFSGLHYWLPKMTGRMTSEGLGQWSFWLSFVGFNLTFFPMHIMGFLGLTRRVYTYSSSLEIDGYNMVATVGAFMMAAGFVLIVVNFGRSVFGGPPAGKNPWKAGSLEWSVPSPPPVYSFLRLPAVASRYPVWAGEKEVRDEVAERAIDALEAEPVKWRATLATDPLFGRPQAVQFLAGPSRFPILAALGILTAFLGALIQWHLLLPAGLIYAAAMIIRWLNPAEDHVEMLRESPVPRNAGLPVFVTGRRSTAWWGMFGLIAICATGLGALFFAYFYLWLFSDRWPQGGINLPVVHLALPAYLLLLLAAGAMFGSLRGFGRGKAGMAGAGLLGAGLLGLLFMFLKIYHLARLDFSHDANAYGSVYFVISGCLLFLVMAGVIMAGCALVRLRRVGCRQEDYLPLQMQLTGMFWYFLATAAVAVFAVLYISPWILGS